MPTGAAPPCRCIPARDVAKGTLRGILTDVGMTVQDLQRLL
jgi:hypothetical protein